MFGGSERTYIHIDLENCFSLSWKLMKKNKMKKKKNATKQTVAGSIQRRFLRQQHYVDTPFILRRQEETHDITLISNDESSLRRMQTHYGKHDKMWKILKSFTPFFS